MSSNEQRSAIKLSNAQDSDLQLPLNTASSGDEQGLPTDGARNTTRMTGSIVHEQTVPSSNATLQTTSRPGSGPNTNTSVTQISSQLHFNTSITTTDDGSSNARQCISSWADWSGSSTGFGSVTTTGYFTYTEWEAHTTSLGGCDTHARLVGSFTPTVCLFDDNRS